LVNFKYNLFTATFKNIINPNNDVVSPMTIQVYKEFDDETSEYSGMITQTTSYIIPPDTYKVEGGEITVASITTSSTILSDSDGNVATISFTPVTDMDAVDGKITINVPVWSVTYDHTISMSVSEFPIGGDNFECSSTAFTTMDISNS
jgi:hypothetical protein